MKILDEILEVKKNNSKDKDSQRVIILLLIAKRLRKSKKIINKIVFKIYMIGVDFYVKELLNNHIPVQTEIGKNLQISHPFGIIINPNAKIGNNVVLRQQVTIGNNGYTSEAPTIGDNVQIGAGAKIIGGIFIGNNSFVGANAVVTKSWPENSVLVGVPAINIADKSKYKKDFDIGK